MQEVFRIQEFIKSMYPDLLSSVRNKGIFIRLAVKIM